MYESNVEKGMKFLDGIDPEWWEKINPRTLKLKDQCKCVLGQLYCDFDCGRKILGLSESLAESFGFILPDFPESDYNKLTAMWKSKIRERRDKENAWAKKRKLMMAGRRFR